MNWKELFSDWLAVTLELIANHVRNNGILRGQKAEHGSAERGEYAADLDDGPEQRYTAADQYKDGTE